jgi:hypothetical protein
MIRYSELVRKKLIELNTDVYTFFRICHIKKFGKDPDLHDTVAQFLLHGTVPTFVQEFLDEE